MIEEANVLERARRLLTEREESVEYAIGNLRLLIPSAVSLLFERKKSDPKFAKNFIVTTPDIEIQVGEYAEAAAELDSVGMIPSEFCGSEITFAVAPNPPIVRVQMVASLDRLNLTGIEDAFFIKCYQTGTFFQFKHPTDELAGLSFKIRGECISNDLSKLPASLEGALALIIADLAPKDGKPNNLGLQIAANKV